MQLSSLLATRRFNAYNSILCAFGLMPDYITTLFGGICEIQFFNFIYTFIIFNAGFGSG